MFFGFTEIAFKRSGNFADSDFNGQIFSTFLSSFFLIFSSTWDGWQDPTWEARISQITDFSVFYAFLTGE